MLDDWEENLAIITANRTNDDGLVMIHLGDCLWKEKGEVGISTLSGLFTYNFCKSVKAEIVNIHLLISR